MEREDLFTKGALTTPRTRTRILMEWHRAGLRVPAWVRRALDNELPPCIVGGRKV